MMDRDTLGYNGRRCPKNLGELTSGDYLTFGALIWHRELIGLTLLLLMDSENMLFVISDNAPNKLHSQYFLKWYHIHNVFQNGS